MTYECKFCLNEFKKEGTFLKHECREMIRDEQLRTPEGMAGYSLYGMWMEFCNRKVPSLETYATSRFYNAFIKFGIFIKRVQIPIVDRYISIMIEKDISPILWTRDECYAMYLEWNDRKSDPFEQIEITINTLDRIAEINEVPTSEVFNDIDSRDILQLIRTRKLSPWLLLFSSKFRTKCKSLSNDDRQHFEAVISYPYWSEKFQKDPELIKHIKSIAKEMGI